MLPVESPFKTYTGLDGKPLDNGYVYFGQPGQDPTMYPVTVYWDAEGQLPAFQPLRTVNGYIMRGGTPANVFYDGAYSELVKDSKGRQVFYSQTSDSFSIGTLVSGLFMAAGGSLIGYALNIAGAIKRTVADVLDETPSVKNFGLSGDGVTGNTAAIGSMLAKLGAGMYELVVPRGDYLVNANVTIPTNIALRFRAGARLLIPDGVTLTLNNPELLAGRQQIFRCIGTGKVIGTIRNDLIFPEWWGAIADGLHPPVGTDFSARAAAAARNAPPLQAALDFAGYSYPVNGLTGTVSLTYGFYVYDKTLKIPLSVNLIGYGIGSALFYYAPTGNAVENIGTNNSLISDIFIAPIGGSNGGTSWNESTGFGLYMDGVSTPIVRNVWSSGFIGGTFYFKNVIEGRLTGLISDNSHGPSFTIRGVGQGTVLETCVTAGTSNGACFDIQSGYDWHLIGCTGKGRQNGTNGFYLNGCENINLTNCGTHDARREGIILTASALNCTLVNCFVNGASLASPGVYTGISVSGTRNKLIAPKVTANNPQYNYGITLGGAATDCTVVSENITPGTLGSILDGQPTGANTYHVRKVSTADATPVTLWTKSLNNNAGCVIEATVMAKQRGTTGESATFKVWARAATGPNGTTMSAPAAIYSGKSNAASLINATFVLTNAGANAGVVSLQVTGLGGAVASVDWEAIVNVISVTG